MNKTDYAFAVARVRACERYLLSQNDVERLIEARSFSEACSLLGEHGWTFEGDGAEIENALKSEQKKLFALLSESVGEGSSALDVLFVQNDFFNLKAALKCTITGKDAMAYFVYPSTLEPTSLVSAMASHDFDSLPPRFASVAAEAYDLACRTENGQDADIIIDKAALNAYASLAKESDCPVLFEAAQYVCDCTDIKVAYRCAKAKKSLSFVKGALSDASALDKTLVSKAASEGTQSLLEYLKTTPYSKEADLISKGLAAFEKGVDDAVIEIMKKAKFVFFGFEPLAAYYYAKVAELKTVRIILVSKQSGIDENTIRERVRTLYV